MENGEWELPVSQHVVRPLPQIKHSEPPAVKEATLGEKQKLWGKTSILHSSFVEEKECNSQSSEHGPSVFQEEHATSPFSEDWEWEERGMTTSDYKPI